LTLPVKQSEQVFQNQLTAVGAAVSGFEVVLDVGSASGWFHSVSVHSHETAGLTAARQAFAVLQPV